VVAGQLKTDAASEGRRFHPECCLHKPSVPACTSSRDTAFPSRNTCVRSSNNRGHAMPLKKPEARACSPHMVHASELFRRIGKTVPPGRGGSPAAGSTPCVDVAPLLLSIASIVTTPAGAAPVRSHRLGNPFFLRFPMGESAGPLQQWKGFERQQKSRSQRQHNSGRRRIKADPPYRKHSDARRGTGG